MKRLATLLVFLAAAGTGARAAEPEALRLVQTISLPEVEGRIDHLALDPGRQTLFVAELGNDTLGVVDLRSARQVQQVTGFDEPQGVAVAPDLDRIVIANGGTGAVDILDAGTMAPLGRIDLSGDADNVRYDPADGAVYVGHGDGAIGIVDAASGRRLGDIALAGHPEAFQLERGGPRLFVNVPAAGQVAVVDRAVRSVTATWPVTGAGANFPMALDEAGARLFVGTRHPAAVIVFDTATGTEIARAGACDDADDLFYDAARQRLYLACGEGVVDALSAEPGGDYALIASIRTAEGARTALFVPDQDRLYVAAPHRGNRQAEIRIYQMQP